MFLALSLVMASTVLTTVFLSVCEQDSSESCWWVFVNSGIDNGPGKIDYILEG